MKKNDILTFIAPNGVKVKGVCLHRVFQGVGRTLYLCYAQNRLFTMLVESIMTDRGEETTMKYQEVIAEYAVIPEYDKLLANLVNNDI